MQLYCMYTKKVFFKKQKDAEKNCVCLYTLTIKNNIPRYY
jgi:hypothetical protein